MSMDFEGARREMPELKPDDNLFFIMGQIHAWFKSREPEIRHALSAMAAVQSGEWKLVPVEPTEEMYEAIKAEANRQIPISGINQVTSGIVIYQEAINASPEFSSDA